MRTFIQYALILILSILAYGCVTADPTEDRTPQQAPPQPAYQQQTIKVKQRLQQDRIAGFKAGLTSVSAQRRFKVEEPVAGVLLASGKRVPGTTIRSSDYGKLMLETEIGFVLKSAITEPVTSLTELEPLIAGVAAVIEVPDLGLLNGDISSTGLIINNVAAQLFISGSARTPAQINANAIDLNNVQPKLYRDGELVNLGNGSDAMGDQWQALRWLINHRLAQGWQLQPGQLLITGALGNMIDAQPGAYQADFGFLGTLNFVVD